MKLSADRRSLWIFLALLPLYPPTVGRAAADPTASPPAASAPDNIDRLAKALVAAASDDDRRKLLAAAQAGLAGDESLRRQVHKEITGLIDTGEYDRASALLAFCRRWCEEHADQAGIMLSEWGEGNIAGYRGNNREALEKYEPVRRFFAQTGDTNKEAAALSNISAIYDRLGDYPRALAGGERALAIHRQLGNRERMIVDLELLGNIYLDEGQTERAASYYEEGLAQAGDDEAWQVYLFQNIANTRAARGDLAGAITLMKQTLALSRKIKDQPREALALSTLGDLQVEAGHWKEAEEFYRESLAEGEALKETQRQFVALVGLGNVVAHRAEEPPESLAEALGLAQRATALAHATGTPNDIWSARSLAGHLLRLAGQDAEAHAALTEAIAAIEDERGRLTSNDEEAPAYFEDKLGPYHEMVALLVGENQPNEALAFAERSKARVLLEVLRGPKNGFDETLSPGERETLKNCGDLIASLNKKLATATTAQRTEMLEELRHARLARESAEDKVLEAHPELRRQVPPREQEVKAPSAAEFSPLLGSDGRGALLEFAVGTDETFAFVVRRPAETAAGAGQSPPRVQVFRLPLGNSILAARTRAYRKTLSDRGLDWTEQARSLGEDLLGAVRPSLTGVQRLVIVPDGPLWELPFQTLPDKPGDGEMSASDTLSGRRLSFAPSLGFLLQARTAGISRSEPTTGYVRLLAFGNPSLGRPGVAAQETLVLRSEELVPLPDAEREVKALGALYGDEHSQVFVGRDARETTFRREASGDYNVIHLATHSVCNDRAPLYSHLLFSQANLEPGEDGFLEAWEIMRLPIRARLVVLSGCETARGRVGAGEGMIGLSWALFTAGCPSCVVSQWQVDSASNTDLMVEFHRQLRVGAGRAEALRQASLALAARPEYRHPFYWAPFVLIGDEN